MIKTIFNIIIYTCLIYSLYYGVMAIFAFLKTKKSETLKKLNTFAILIAARNEENVIGHLIESLKKQNYDKNYYDIYVIVNNCVDNTEIIAKKNGANIIKCRNSKCKADALRFAFNHLKKKNIDAYLIFDADNVVHPDFLTHMNDSINNGYKVAQGTRSIKNIKGNWISDSYAIYYYLQSFFILRARKNIGLSAAINGTGFMIKKEIIDEFGFNTVSLTEDIEFSGICALNNIKIDYVEKALSYDEQPTDFDVSWKQRMRWTKGSLECLKIYSFKLIKNFFKNFSLANIDILFLYAAPVIQIVSFVAIFLSILLDLIKYSFSEFINIYIINNAFSIICSYLMFLFLATFIVIYNKHSIKEFIGGILFFIIFIFTWIPINIICLFKRKMSWSPIIHKNKISINEIIGK